MVVPAESSEHGCHLGTAIARSARGLEWNDQFAPKASTDGRNNRCRCAGPGRAKAVYRATEILAGTRKASYFVNPASPAVAGGAGGSGGSYAVLPPGMLGALATGQDDLHPPYLRAALRPMYELTERYEIENPAFSSFVRFDPAFVFVLMLPLYLLVVSRDLFAAERECGTLALLASEGVSLPLLAVSRLTVRLCAAIAVCGVCVFAALATSRSVSGASAYWPVCFGLLLVLCLYTLFWLLAALVVNLWLSSAATASLSLLTLWIAVVIVWPGVLSLVSSALYPAPSRIAMVQAYRRASAAATTAGDRSLAGYFHDHPELSGESSDSPMSDYYATSVAVQDVTETKVRPVLAAFEQERNKRDRWITAFSRFSPATTMQMAMEDAAGSGDRRYWGFLNQFQEFLVRWRQFFVPRIFQKTPMDATAYAQIPIFHYNEQSTRTTIHILLTDTSCIALFVCALCLLSVSLFSRFKPV